MSRGRIEKALSGFYYVNTGAETLQCRARGKFRREGMSPLVGDWVQVRDLGGGEGFVEAVEPRRNVFSRPAAANIDQLVILASAAIPVTEPYLIDRIAAIAALLIGLLFAFLFGRYAEKKLGGLTGDVYGAIELMTEVLVLFVLFLFAVLPFDRAGCFLWM